MTTKVPVAMLNPAGSAGQVLTSNGLGVAPSYQAIGAGGGDPAQLGSELFQTGGGYTAGTSNTITLAVAPVSIAHIQVFFNGDIQQRDQYSLLGNVITFTQIIPLNVDRIEVYILGGGTLGINNVFTSTDQVITPAGPLTLAHGLGSIPYFVTLTLVCQIAEHGYSIGDLIESPMGSGFKANDSGTSIVKTATNLVIRYGAGTGGGLPVFTILDKTAGTDASITNVNWKARFRAYK